MTPKTCFASRAAYLVVCLLGLLSLSATAQVTINPTTTLAAETSNNTSASSSFKSQTNGNAGAGNVSKLPIRNLLYPGSTTKIYAAVMPWFGRSDHMSVGYTSSDPALIHAQVDDMLSRGIQGTIIPWYGSDPDIQSAMAVNYLAEANSRGGAFEVAIMIDVGALVSYAQHFGCDVTQQLIDHLGYIANTFYGGSAYSKVGGRPVVYFFDVDAYYIDWDKVRASVPGNPLFLKRNPGGFTAAQSNGAYSWVEINLSNPDDMMLSYLDDFYATAAQYPSQYAVASTYKGFNDTLADWGSNRIVKQHCGQTWLATFREINKYYSSSHQLPALQLVTWSDYEEGTEMETGIDNCASVSAAVTGSTLNWAIGPDASDSTIDHFTAFISTDGQNLMPLANISSGTHSLDLAQFHLPAANYVLYVKAVGLPSILNHMSPALGFNPANQAPLPSLAVDPSLGPAPLAVTASSEGSTDPDGSIVSAQIDFGDGFVAPGPTATHTYQNPGEYTVTLTLVDNGGLFTKTQMKVSVAAGPGVTITSPGNGATVNTPVHVSATASIPGGVSYMEVLIDGVVKYVTAGASVNTSLKVDAGTHELRVAAHDTTPAANYITSTITINVGSNDTPPTAHLTVTPFNGGNKVMACTATSTDSDGFITDSFVDFGDGSTGSGPTAFHTYGSPGTYTLTATVTDNAGVSSQTTSQITIGTPPGGGTCAQPSSPGVNLCSPANGSTVASSFTISAAGRTTNPIEGMDVWLDGVKLRWFAGTTSVEMQATAGAGAHQLDIYAVASGELRKQTSIFTVSGSPPPPSSCPTPGAPGVNICSPASGSSNSVPIRILASGRNSGATGGMDVWIDGVKFNWYAGANTVDVTDSNVGPGTHKLDIYAVGTNGEKQFATVTFAVSGVSACPVPSAPGVNICAPANGSTVGSPLHIVAAGRDNSTTDGLDIWLDGAKVGYFRDNTVVTDVMNVGAGSHQLDIYAVGVDGELQVKTVFFTVT